jgi:hypothetical protein
MNGRVQPLEIPGALLVEAAGSADERGGFFEYLRAADLQGAGCGLEVTQVNCSVSVSVSVAGAPSGSVAMSPNSMPSHTIVYATRGRFRRSGTPPRAVRAG